MKKKYQNFSLRIGLANDTTIRSWSFGEVLKAETINYKTEKPVPTGLFCEKIFGPVKSNECACGKYQRIRYKGKVCEVCGVTVTDSIVRRRRMGHIELNDPIVHVWFYRVSPSPIALLLDFEPDQLAQLINYKIFILTDNNGEADLPENLVINLQFSSMSKDSKTFKETAENFKLLLKYTMKSLEIGSPSYSEAQAFMAELDEGENAIFFVEEFIHLINEISPFKLETGGAAVETLLKKIDVEHELNRLKQQSTPKGKKKKLNPSSRMFKKLLLLNNFSRTGQRPEWMVTRTIPVLPPELRPIVHIEGGRFATSGVNRLYNDLLIRKNRLLKHQERQSPLFMINQLRALVQGAADTLFDKSLGKAPITRTGRDASITTNINSIADNLKGKTGRFRQNLLGKRVDFSAGSVIVGGPNLKLNECGLPRDIAVVLFRSAIIGELLQRDPSLNKKSAEKIIIDRAPVVWNILTKLVKNYPVILNRAPTLHRLGVQGFYPKLVRGKAIQLHPLVTTAFNADFDGDRMPIHLPLTDDAKLEVENVLMSTKNILNPRNGQIIVMPSQDIILGLYYITMEERDNQAHGSLFATPQIAMLAYEKQKIQLHTQIFLPVNSLGKSELVDKDGFILTTVGKLIFNAPFDTDFPYINAPIWGDNKLNIIDVNANLNEILESTPLNQPITKAVLTDIVDQYFEMLGSEKLIVLLDELKDLGFAYSTKSGITISFFDLITDRPEKADLYKAAKTKLGLLNKYLDTGGITTGERVQKRIDLWTNIKEKLEKKLQKSYNFDNNRSIHAMVNSGARGSIASITQLVAMRGLMVNTKGKIIDTPITSSLSEGLDPLEYFISTYGARKGMVDTALKTADSGYLTRCLVDSSHDVYTSAGDCKTEKFVNATALWDQRNDTEIITLENRIFSRVLAKDLRTPNKIDTGDVRFEKNTLITKAVAKEIVSHGYTSVPVRTPLTCASIRSICIYCYGLDLAKNELIEPGQAVGVLAAQSIGEPATQLTMRTFHAGGVSDVSDITQGLPRVIELFDVVTLKSNKAYLSTASGKITEITTSSIGKSDKITTTITIVKEGEKKPFKVLIPGFAPLIVKVGHEIMTGDPLSDGAIDLKELLKLSGNPQKVAEYIVSEVQHVYCSQGIDISDKYIEIIAIKMLSRSLITNAGDSQYIAGEEVEGHIIKTNNIQLKADKKDLIVGDILISGIKRIASRTQSFLSAASFQETTKVLIRSVLENRIDPLFGLKENVIVGNLIPVGTGYAVDQEKKAAYNASLTQKTTPRTHGNK